ncbi:MAG: hypothetical protein ACOCXT_05230 [Candidatus Dojkabacteria bacterium]
MSRNYNKIIILLKASFITIVFVVFLHLVLLTNSVPNSSAYAYYGGKVYVESTQNIEPARSYSLTLPIEPVRPRDMRAIRLEVYLQEKNSPLAGYSDLVISLSDRYGISYKIPVALAGVESSFCLVQFRENNCWGYGDYSWSSLRTGIQEYMRLMNTWYFSKGLRTIETISEVYNPYPEKFSEKVQRYIEEIP